MQKKTKKAKKVIEAFRIPVDRKLTPVERRDVEDKIKQYIKELTKR